MKAEKLILYYNRLNGNAINLTTLKQYHGEVQAYLDSDSHGPHVPDLRGIQTRLTRAIKDIIAAGAKGAEKIELTPIDISKKSLGEPEDEQRAAMFAKLQSEGKLYKKDQTGKRTPKKTETEALTIFTESKYSNSDKKSVEIVKEKLNLKKSESELLNDLSKQLVESKLPKKLFPKKLKIDLIHIRDAGHLNIEPIALKIKKLSPVESLLDLRGADAINYKLNGIYFDEVNQKVVATDANVLCAIDFEVKKGGIKHHRDFSDSNRIIDEKYPDWKSIVPKKQDTVYLLTLSSLSKQIDLLAGASQANRFFSSDPVPVIYSLLTVDGQYFYFNPLFLMKGLKVFVQNGIDKVTIQLTKPSRAMKITSVNDKAGKNIMVLVMPVMSDSENPAHIDFRVKLVKKNSQKVSTAVLSGVGQQVLKLSKPKSRKLKKKKIAKVERKPKSKPESKGPLPPVESKENSQAVAVSKTLSGVSYKFYSHNLGEYQADFYKLNSDTIVMIWGKPGHGKTVYLLKLAKYFAVSGKKVLYISDEEYGRSTLEEKLTEFGIDHENLTIKGELNESDIEANEIIFFDSITSMKLTPEMVKKLQRRHPNKLFFLIVQTTKAGDFRGGQDWEHLVDVAGEISNRKLILQKNRFDKDNFIKADKLQTEDAIIEAKKKKKIQEAVKEEMLPKPQQQAA